MKSKSVIMGVVIVALLAVVGFLVFHKSPAKQSGSTSSQSSSSSQSADTITFDGSSFSPASLTVKSGTTITIKNTSSDDLAFDSNPHPVHTDDTQLNMGDVAPGQSKTFTVTKTGTFGYHDHLDPGLGGSITIQ